MWILECEGDVLGHKRIWLRPGKTYLFGRTKPETGRYRTGFQINHKTVSRKHLILKIAAVEPDDVGIVGKRSEITFEDAGTKLGTTVDDQKITNGGKITTAEGTHVFKPSGYEHTFKVTWKPVIFSYTFSSKEYKNGKDPLDPIRARLAELDVKALDNYASGRTTHVIASKRNTARGLQALVQGARIVTDEFVSVLEAAATSEDLAEAESFAPLEQDFARGWPNETDYLPPAGKEPGPKDPKYYAPTEGRSDMFHGMTFIFFDSRQYDNLQPPITDGGGKAAHFSIEPDVTTAQDAHRYVKETAGERDHGELSGDNKVICVKFGSPQGSEEWSDKFASDLCLATGYRAIEQNEFLEAILRKDPQRLFRRLEYADESDQTATVPVRPSQSTAPQAVNPTVHQSAVQDVKPRPRRIQRGKIQSTFKGFDDGADDVAMDTAPIDFANGSNSTTNGLVKDGIVLGNGRSGTNRKRPISDSDDDDAELQQLEANMFKGANAMKKRRLENKAFDTDEADTGTSTRATSELIATDELPAKRKAKKELDINAALRAHREAEEAKRRAGGRSDEENDPNIDELTLDQMKTLAVVEEFEPKVPSGGNALQRRAGDPSRWKDEWNGRKNFKKFRRQGETANLNRGRTVIVPLEEVKSRDLGISELTWSTSAPNSRVGRVRLGRESSDEEENTLSRRSAASRSQLSKQTRSIDVAEDDRANGNVGAEEDAVHDTVPTNLTTGDEPEVIDVDEPRTTRAHGPATATQQSSSVTGSKRASAATQSSNGTATVAKRQKRLDEVPRRPRQDAGSGSDDDVKFRFRRRK